MALDQSKIGTVPAVLMEQLEQEGFGEDAEIGAVCLLVEVSSPTGSQVTLQVSDPRNHVNVGMLEIGKATLLAGSRPGGS